MLSAKGLPVAQTCDIQLLKKLLHPRLLTAEFQVSIIKRIHSHGTAENQLKLGASREGSLLFVYLPFKAPQVFVHVTTYPNMLWWLLLLLIDLLCISPLQRFLFVFYCHLCSYSAVLQ